MRKVRLKIKNVIPATCAGLRRSKAVVSLIFILVACSFAAQSAYDLMERANALYRDNYLL